MIIGLLHNYWLIIGEGGEVVIGWQSHCFINEAKTTQQLAYKRHVIITPKSGKRYFVELEQWE